jgi:ankyrin repeat protein
MIATAEGHPDTVQALIDAGATVNTANQHGRTALMFAAKYGFDDIVLTLVKKGADVNLASNDEEGLSALMAASARGKNGVVEILLKNGANVNAKSKTGMTSLDYALKGGYTDVIQILKAAGAK